MITKEMVYEEKRQFVNKLEEALLCLDEIRGIEYRASSSKYIELVRIDWHGEGGPHEYINVTGNSLRAILCEVMSLIQEGWALGQIEIPGRGDKLWEELWDDSDDEEKKAPEGYKPNPEYIETKSKRVQLLVQPSVYEAVKAKAKGLGISINEAINEALREYKTGRRRSDV